MDLRAADRTIRNAKPRDMGYDLPLGGGLSARIAADGSTKTIYWRGKVSRHVVRVKLGNYPALTMIAAHAKALDIRSMVKNGEDPTLKARRKKAGTNVPTLVREAADRFIKEHLKVRIGTGWAAEAERILNVDILPKLGAYRLDDIRRADLTSLAAEKAAGLRKVGKKGTAANRLTAVLGKFLGFCADQGWIEVNPAARLPKPVDETRRDRTLTGDEIAALWTALDAACKGAGLVPPSFARVLTALLLTGCRASEITNLRRGAFDPNAGTIEIEGGKTDASRRKLPIGPMALAVLAEAMNAAPEAGTTDDAANPTDAMLFPAPRSKDIIGSSEISKAARTLVAKLGHKSWTPHDLRRSLVTQLHEAGVDEGIVRRIAGHVGSDVHASTYDRSRQLEKIRDAFLVYEQFVRDCIQKAHEKQCDNVVYFQVSN